MDNNEAFVAASRVWAKVIALAVVAIFGTLSYTAYEHGCAGGRVGECGQACDKQNGHMASYDMRTRTCTCAEAFRPVTPAASSAP